MAVLVYKNHMTLSNHLDIILLFFLCYTVVQFYSIKLRTKTKRSKIINNTKLNKSYCIRQIDESHPV